ncbi:MAG: phosphate ABC transporter substrate-binding protein PstS [Candidatus Dormibacteraeota bacterium]|nr:phosphate ABC transporter substrate-binding protein PstS [Candidatus Dormibacteraeota bacterium]
MGTRLIGGAALLGTLTLAACGGSSSSTATTPTPTPTPVTIQTGNPTTPVTLHEDGSSLLFPLLNGDPKATPPFNGLAAQLTAAYSNITVSPAAGGSGKGISDTISGAVDMGGSDAYLSPGQAAQNPNLQNIPIAVSSQDVYVNVPGVSSIKLDGDTLAKIYMGQITSWSDPAIKADNPSATLPSTNIVPVRRVDSSGDTFLFTSFLSATNMAWSNGPSIGTTITWPSVSAEVTASGNPGMVNACKANPGCVAYIGISAQSSANTAGLTLASLKNASGQFLNANPSTMQAAVDAAASSVPDSLSQSLIYQNGAMAYPIVNFEYIIVNAMQSSTDKALAIRTFLAWAIDPSAGSTTANLSHENFIALPQSVVNKVKAAIAKIA